MIVLRPEPGDGRGKGPGPCARCICLRDSGWLLCRRVNLAFPALCLVVNSAQPAVPSRKPSVCLWLSCGHCYGVPSVIAPYPPA